MLLIICLDQLSKYWARPITEPLYFWGFKIEPVLNNGVMLGYFSDLPLNVKEVTLTTLGAFVMAFYLLGLWLLPIRSRSTYLGLSILVGGIMGNVADRFNGFAVVDFLTINVSNKRLPYVNLADLSQWIGYILITIGLYRDSLYYWPEKDWRNKFIIKAHFQVRASLLMAMFSFFSAIITLVFSYAFLKNNQSQLIFKHYFISAFFLTCVISSITFFISLALSHRVAGPIYAIQRHIRSILKGKNIPFKLREYDEFKEIEKELNLLSEVIASKNDPSPPLSPENKTDKKRAS